MGTGSLQAAFDRSLKDPAGFWGEAAEAVHWYKKWDKVLDDSRQPLNKIGRSKEAEENFRKAENLEHPKES